MASRHSARWTCAATLAAVALGLASCGKREKAGDLVRPPPAKPTAPGHTQLASEIRVSAREAAIPEAAIEDFAKASGVHVMIQAIPSEEFVAEWLETDRAGDLVLAPEEALSHYAESGALRPASAAMAAARTNVDARFLTTPESALIPYAFDVLGIARDPAAIPANPSSWGTLFNPAMRAQSTGVVAAFNLGDPFAAALVFLGGNPAAREPDAVADAAALVAALAPVPGGAESLATGHAALALAWASELPEDTRRDHFAVPREGAVVRVDALAIPAASSQPQTAEAFAAFLLLHPARAPGTLPFRCAANAAHTPLSPGVPVLRAPPSNGGDDPALVDALARASADLQAGRAAAEHAKAPGPEAAGSTNVLRPAEEPPAPLPDSNL